MIWGDVGKYGSKRETAKDPEKKTGPNTFIHILTISSIDLYSSNKHMDTWQYMT